MIGAAAEAPSGPAGGRSRTRPAWSVYLGFVENAFLNMLAYRLRYFTGIMTYLMFVSVHYFIWSAVYAGGGGQERINGFTLEEMVTYVAIGWIARSLYFSNVDYEINELVKSGQVSIFLLRPVNFHLMMICQAAGESVFRFLFFTLPIGAVILAAFPVMLPHSLPDFLLFVLATIFSFMVLAEINFLVGLLSFVLMSVDGVMRAKYFLVQLLSGLLLPLTFFPSWLAGVLDLLPFKLIAYVPLQFYLGKIPRDEVLWILGQQAVWTCVLAVASGCLWQRVLNRLTLQGG